jgi:hypothetical protein
MSAEPQPNIANDGWPDATQRQAAARAAYQRSVEHGTPLSSAALAAQIRPVTPVGSRPHRRSPQPAHRPPAVPQRTRQ